MSAGPAAGPASAGPASAGPAAGPARGSASAERPGRVILIAGTGTEVGKTWVSCRLLEAWRRDGHRVSARKPAQSFEPDDDPAATDAALLARAAGEEATAVCGRHRWYPVAMAPPMAADVLGRPPFGVAELVGETGWSPGAPVATGSVGIVESAGGIRSPQATDGDVVDLGRLLWPDVVLLVADAGLGTINAVRLGHDALGALAVPVVTALNRFDPGDELHRRNRDWLAGRDHLDVLTLDSGTGTGTGIGALADRLLRTSP